MPTAWRIVREKYTATAFSGEGASKTGGRWNSRGVSMVYTSASKSLAALEILVHVEPTLPFRYQVFRVDFEESALEIHSQTGLPKDWQSEPPPLSTRFIGDMWTREARSAVLAVPSILVTDEWNYLFNPGHPDFRKINIGKPVDFAFDPRLINKKR
jgi:RES domain-containing protein